MSEHESAWTVNILTLGQIRRRRRVSWALGRLAIVLLTSA